MVMRGFAFLSVALSSSLFLLGAAVAVEMVMESGWTATVRVTLSDGRNIEFPGLLLASDEGGERTTSYPGSSDRFEVTTTHKGNQGQAAWEGDYSYFWTGTGASAVIYKIHIVHTHTAAVTNIKKVDVSINKHTKVK